MKEPIINIPTPQPIDFNVNLVGLKNVAVSRAYTKLPKPVTAVIKDLLHPPSAQDVINDFLTKMPEPQEAISKPKLSMPPFTTNNMVRVTSGTALNGTALYSNLEITGKSWTDFNGQVKSYPGMSFNTVIITTHQQKNIVETQIQGSDDGAVIEYSGLGNYDVDIRIIVTGNNDNGIYPQSFVEDIIKMLTAPVSISVSSWYLLMLDIQDLVITSYDIAQVEGGISQQPIIIQAKSVKNHTLVIQ